MDTPELAAVTPDEKPIDERTEVETAEKPVETEEVSTSTKRMPRQWGVAAALVPFGGTIALTGFAAPDLAWLITGIGGIVVGVGLGVLIFPFRTVTHTLNRYTTVNTMLVTRVYAPNPKLRPFPPGQTTHFLAEREMLSRDHADFVAAFGPGLRAGAYDQAMHDLDELVRERHADAQRLIGVQDDKRIADAVNSFYRGWVNAVDKHYTRRQREDEQERTGQKVDQRPSREIEDEMWTFLETARQAISDRDRQLAFGE